MFNRKTVWLAAIYLTAAVLLAGCLGQQSAPEKMYEIMEKVVALEDSFEKQQEPLLKLEKEEKELYGKMIELGMKEYDQIVNLSDQALTIVDKRKKHMEAEVKSINASEKEFQKLERIIEDIDDKELKKQADDLYGTMQKRYDAHRVLAENYSNGLGYDRELYEMFKQEDLTIEKLEEQINKINATYKKVLETNEQFNTYTEDYNDSKRKFYETAGLGIEE
ncbi:hypothetical protein CVD25_13000 [Bacillus canaveralius]|uniref:Lipoprotein n=1 Tax=Bacillus canaveralius TaxID=1403243 RepID=A0A2N5GNI6_9BACI|nr:YkyA family protein [Bacillus canaveralius]PLR84047.1 hypothetical protein CU635_07005 [Bacillus canaveralius]PLR96308.1 hypothetical protein CVD25_13000 [Bacillus canaveralius]RSK53505.1 hypothetical protein EJA13_08010 [Bacillus canaveralius]